MVLVDIWLSVGMILVCAFVCVWCMHALMYVCSCTHVLMCVHAVHTYMCMSVPACLCVYAFSILGVI